MVKVLTEASFKEGTSNGLVLLKFGANWCGPCKMITPSLTEISRDRNDVSIVEVDTDDSPDLAQRFQVRGIPAMYIMKNGQILEQAAGMMSKNKINELIDRHI